MKFGIHNPSWLFGPDPYEIFEALKKKAQWAESNGFSWFSLMDHLIQIPNVGVEDEPFMEGWSTLSALAAVTSKIRLATLVTSVAYRNPAHLAKIAAGVDIISRGRLTFGIGAGWHVREYQQYGWEFPEQPAVRIAQMEEAIQLVLKMWSEPRATFHGKYFHIDEAILEPKPATVKHKLNVLRGHCDQAGRDYESIERTCLTSFLIAKDEAALQAKKAHLNLPDPFRGNALTVPQAIDLVGAYQEAGAQMLIFSSYINDVETLELFAAEVLPMFV
jgi:hypothetical protein